MGSRDYLVRLLIVAGVIGLMTGCSWLNRYGKLMPAWSSTTKMTIEQLFETWQDYHVSYAGVSIENPAAIMFDPKEDDRKLLGHKWVQVKSQEEMVGLIDWIRVNEIAYPVLWRILDPNNQLYGYMYSAWNHAHIKVADERTLWVDDILLPPIDYGPSKGSGPAGP